MDNGLGRLGPTTRCREASCVLSKAMTGLPPGPCLLACRIWLSRTELFETHPVQSGKSWFLYSSHESGARRLVSSIATNAELMGIGSKLKQQGGGRHGWPVL